MKPKSYPRYILSHCCLKAVTLMALTATSPAALLPDYVITVVPQNKTGVTVNDLHLQLLHSVSKSSSPADFASDTFNNVTYVDAVKTLDWSGAGGGRTGSVAPGGSASVSWWSKFASDTSVTGYWTVDGTQKGGVFQVGNGDEAFNLQDNGDGTVTLALVNSGPNPVAYSGLSVENGASMVDFDPNDAFADMNTGSAVTLLVPDSGMLAVGTTAVATFTPSSTGYEGESVTIDGNTFSVAEAVPEPSAALFAVFGAAFCCLCRRSSRFHRCFAR